MATVTINNSPIHGDSILTAVYGETGTHWARFHTGTDFVPYGETESQPLLYSVVDGEVVYINNTSTPALGVQCLIKDNQNRYWRYCHMVVDSLQVQLGDRVTTNNVIGRMGATGNVTGIHLHLECGTTYAWSYDTFLNPSEQLGIPNVRGTIVKYDGETPPFPPTPSLKIKRKKFPWVIYANKFRNRRI